MLAFIRYILLLVLNFEIRICNAIYYNIAMEVTANFEQI